LAWLNALSSSWFRPREKFESCTPLARMVPSVIVAAGRAATHRAPLQRNAGPSGEASADMPSTIRSGNQQAGITWTGSVTEGYFGSVPCARREAYPAYSRGGCSRRCLQEPPGPFKAAARVANSEIDSRAANLREAASKAPNDKRRISLIARSCAASAEARGVLTSYRIVAIECMGDTRERSDFLNELDRAISQIRTMLDRACD
jgi:hypothetical protein